ncbi:hypothetical protein [Sphaerisporangium perillae]|uniref:hypothetical protein n=1 Tax=Sphaerisporangium perillae TaxID=2935860 RepID=UPI00200F6F90|nr:hypothetical protein [Sphaerisporangium perillae]
MHSGEAPAEREAQPGTVGRRLLGEGDGLLRGGVGGQQLVRGARLLARLARHGDASERSHDQGAGHGSRDAYPGYVSHGTHLTLLS